MKETLTAKLAHIKTKEKIERLIEDFSKTEHCSDLIRQIELKIEEGEFYYRVLVPLDYFKFLTITEAFLKSKGFEVEIEIYNTGGNQNWQSCQKKYLMVKW